jgi:CubicO group peptidase (beta-lactamase class C family)
MQKFLRIFVILLTASGLLACDDGENPDADVDEDETIYFPPNSGATWETVSSSTLGWNESAIPALISFLDENNSRALIVLKDGKIVLEEYMGKQFDGTTDFAASSNWYWASAGKTLTSALVGIASDEGSVLLNEKSSTYLGQGWSSLTAEQENAILVKHHLTMTTGLDESVANPDCTEKACLTYTAPAGTRWTYHNAPYTLLDEVISNATGKNLNQFVDEKIKSKTGMDGQYLQTGDNNVFYSTARSMARFGLLLLNKGKWNNEQLIPEDYYELMTSSSQQFNLSYGYLTWLNGKANFMIPSTQIVFQGSVSPAAPDDLFAAMGKNGQIINIVPSQNLVVVRIGDAPDNNLVPFTFQDDLWEKLTPIIGE